MKVRSGFVSNSSSSSFIAKGFLIKDKSKLNYEEIMSKFATEKYDYKAEIKKCVEDYGETYEGAVRDVFRDFFRWHFESDIFFAEDYEDGLPAGYDLAIGEYIFDGGESDYYIPDQILDVSMTETLKELKEKFGIDEDVKIFCGSRCC